jgi:hypothetical protein
MLQPGKRFQAAFMEPPGPTLHPYSCIQNLPVRPSPIPLLFT